MRRASKCECTPGANEWRCHVFWETGRGLVKLTSKASDKVHSGGVKPLNAPRVVYVRTDPDGNPISVQVPPAINSPRMRRTPKRFRSTTHPTPSDLSGNVASSPLVSDGKWMKVVAIENLWKVNDEWWRGPEEEISRLYYVLRLKNGQQLTVYLDLIANNWRRQAG